MTMSRSLLGLAAIASLLPFTAAARTADEYFADGNRLFRDDLYWAALLRYRAAIAPSWRHRDAVEQMCRSTEHDGLLDAIERLRYSEEHGVRSRATELTALRRRVSLQMERTLGSVEPTGSPSSLPTTPDK